MSEQVKTHTLHTTPTPTFTHRHSHAGTNRLMQSFLLQVGGAPEVLTVPSEVQASKESLNVAYFPIFWQSFVNIFH